MIIEIPLTRGQVSIVDQIVFEKIPELRSKWFASWCKSTQSYYALRTVINSDGNKTNVAMHRIITDAPRGMQVDHLNHNTLDNRLSNLRLCNRSTNQMNMDKSRDGSKSSIYKGVSWSSKKNKWLAQIKKNRKNHNLGLYETEAEAAIVYNQKAIELFGEFALLNNVSPHG